MLKRDEDLTYFYDVGSFAIFRGHRKSSKGGVEPLQDSINFFTELRIFLNRGKEIEK